MVRASWAPIEICAIVFRVCRIRGANAHDAEVPKPPYTSLFPRLRNVIVIHRSYPGRYAIDLQRLLDRVEGDYLSSLRVNGFKKRPSKRSGNRIPRATHPGGAARPSAVGHRQI